MSFNIDEVKRLLDEQNVYFKDHSPNNLVAADSLYWEFIHRGLLKAKENNILLTGESYKYNTQINHTKK